MIQNRKFVGYLFVKVTYFNHSPCNRVEGIKARFLGKAAKKFPPIGYFSPIALGSMRDPSFLKIEKTYISQQRIPSIYLFLFCLPLLLASSPPIHFPIYTLC